MINTVTVPVALAVQDQTFPVRMDAAIQIVHADFYEGAYEVTPSADEQILQTKDLTLTENITIHPIPDNYGLVTWNGSVLTIS